LVQGVLDELESLMLLLEVDSAGPDTGAQGVLFVHEFADLAEDVGVVHCWPSHSMI
jgi:hypothetical protein